MKEARTLSQFPGILDLFLRHNFLSFVLPASITSYLQSFLLSISTGMFYLLTRAEGNEGYLNGLFFEVFKMRKSEEHLEKK